MQPLFSVKARKGAGRTLKKHDTNGWLKKELAWLHRGLQGAIARTGHLYLSRRVGIKAAE
jgi:hypothetical protein